MTTHFHIHSTWWIIKILEHYVSNNKIWHSCGFRCDFISVSFIPFSYIWECFLDPSRVRRWSYTLRSVLVPCAKQSLKTRWVPLSVGDSRNMFDWGKKRPLNTSTLNQLAIAMFIYSHILFFLWGILNSWKGGQVYLFI